MVGNGDMETVNDESEGFVDYWCPISRFRSVEGGEVVGCEEV
jgi:hypothetical protein